MLIILKYECESSSIKTSEDKVRVLRKKIESVRSSLLALTLTLALFQPSFSASRRIRRAQYPERDLNPHKHYCSQDFKSCVSTIPPSGPVSSCSRAVVQSCSREVRMPDANLNKYVNSLQGLAFPTQLSQVPSTVYLHHRLQHNTSLRDLCISWLFQVVFQV